MGERRRWAFLDLDGTLASSLGALRAAYEEFLSTHASAGTDAEFAALNGAALTEIVARLRADHHIEEREDVLLAEYLGLVERVYGDGVEPMRGAEELLAGLAEDGYALALVTAAPRSAATAAIRGLGWEGRFAVQACGDEVARAKPAPDLYRLALRRAECLPEDAIAVEDSRNGVESASAAGLRVVAVHGARADVPRAVAVPDLGAALAWIREGR